jgi:hypothetical protein
LLVRAEADGFRIAASVRQRADIEEMKHRTFRFGPSTPIGRAVRTASPIMRRRRFTRSSVIRRRSRLATSAARGRISWFRCSKTKK